MKILIMGEPLKTGDLCSHCRKGKLYPTGLRTEIENPKIKSGEAKREQTGFECDECHRKFNAFGIELRN
jgi:hypothetical protein